jgi:hypothetical protein
MPCRDQKRKRCPPDEPHKDKHENGVRKGKYDESRHEDRQESHDDLFLVVGDEDLPSQDPSREKHDGNGGEE